MTGEMGLFFVSALVALSAICSEATSVTPVEKVTSLLGNLAKKIEQEGKDEAASYDKYSCFCKEHASDKLYAIETSNEKIEHMTLKIGKLASDIADLDTDIRNLGTDISDLKIKIDANQVIRNSAHATFLTNQGAADGAIDTVERAIAAMKESKKALIGRVELEAPSLAQVSKVARMALSLRTDLSDSDFTRLSFLATAGKPGEGYRYKYHSNDIIATLQNLLGIFKNRKATLETDEFTAMTEHEMIQQALSNRKKFAEKEKTEKVEVRESKTEEKEATTQDKDEETRDKDSDQAFLNVLKQDCETKAQLWDQRSQTRASELTAISTAMEALKSGVAPNWQANKKLVGLQTHGAVKGHWVYVEESAPARSASAAAPSFLQLQGVSLRGAAHAMSEAQVSSRVHQLLVSAAARLKSPFLSVAALKVQAAEDHFVKVRQIIKDLIQHLNDQAGAEANHKTFCDEQIAREVGTRDQEQTKVEGYKAQIAIKQSDRAQLKSDIADLSKEIAKNKRILAEATQLRQEEYLENTKTIQEAGAGKDAVEFALNTLKAFYEGAAFLQRSGYVPPNSDRQGKTVADLAPEYFDADYKGSQDASKGIIGLLEVILADFGRTGTTVDGQENQAASDFGDMKSANELDTETKEGSVTTKNTAVTTIDDDLVTLNDDLDTAKDAHKAANSVLDSLRSQCIAGEETYAERVATRHKEIEALKEAHGILEDWQK